MISLLFFYIALTCGLLADFVVFFSGGKIKAKGTPEEISDVLKGYRLL